MPSRKQLANAIRALAMDAVQQANSGHPGMPMGMADIAEVLWNDFLQHNPDNPGWHNRDRFMLSNGHGSMLQYALLHLTGYALSMDDLKAFRQLHSKTPGHPEYGDTPGVETTTGPLGQGLANGVGMALAERMLATRFNRPEFELIDHHTYVFVGDGCLMEGISHEVSSLAGTLGLGKLIVIYDDNGISIDGKVEPWYTEDVPQRFLAYHWHVLANVDGHDPIAIKNALQQARAVTDKPTIICCKTIIGYGAPHAAGTAKCHGSALGETEVSLAKKALGWNYAPFEIPAEIYAGWDAREKGAVLEQQWQQQLELYRQQYPELATELLRRLNGDLPDNWQQTVKDFIDTTQQKQANVATRQASQMAIEAFARVLPELFGGSADLTGSNNTDWSGTKIIRHESFDGNYLHYGVREFGMTAILNGIALHGGFIPYGGTFLVFCDYARNAVRLAALMRQRVILVYSHDSIGLGEDGPTHQPIEHASMLRMTPNMSVWRPCDALETAIAWQAALEHCHGPSSLLLSRQTLNYQQHQPENLKNIRKGGYILCENTSDPEVILIATGSEVMLAVAAFERLQAQGKRVRVVSMPCCEQFDVQDVNYRNQVLPSHIHKRIAIEAAATAYWYKYVGLQGKVLGINRFGLSAPAKQIFQDLNLTSEHIVTATLELINN